MDPTATERFWAAVGGRKQANGYLLAILITAMAFPLGASFTEYATAIGVALLGTSATVAYEDAKRPEPDGDAEVAQP